MYKQGDYYKFLFDNYPDRYYYCRMIETIASTKNLINESREYKYYDENNTPKKHFYDRYDHSFPYFSPTVFNKD